MEAGKNLCPHTQNWQPSQREWQWWGRYQSCQPSLRYYDRLVHQQIVDNISFRAQESFNFYHRIAWNKTWHHPRYETWWGTLLWLMIMADFSKAFSLTPSNMQNLLRKLSLLGFWKAYLKWTINYLTGRRQLVRIDRMRYQTYVELNLLYPKDQRKDRTSTVPWISDQNIWFFIPLFRPDPENFK